MANYGKRMVSEVDIAQIGQGGGTEVVANPTLVGTEDTLTGLQVGDTKYVVPQGGSSTTLYRHHITVDAYDSSYNVLCNVLVDITNTSNTAITSLDALKTVLNSGTATYPNKGVLASGAIKDGANVRNIIGLRIVNDAVKGLYVDSSNQYVLYTVVDIPSGAELTDTIFTL